MSNSFIQLQNEYGDLFLERIDNLRNAEKLGEGTRIWWGEDEQGIDYTTPFETVASVLLGDNNAKK